ncbi:thioesterase family protein [Geodermatophilus sp. DSM 44513]|uniref:acyl-CoA thioesterase n=1 Tax=Geodermatophilus sp. DSM 44513 TaxID=1528104 RepID=UPI001412B8CE|nr:acyl-CoA thioesterase [Geodermatophilus sp. DSM 44513]WNV77065.1 acyl-CoA thioesterase [Geodermatophilus sp. DSM 44513]
MEWIDTDAAGIHHNTAITRYTESAEAALMRSRGLQQAYFPRAPRVRYEVDVEAPLRVGQELTAVVDLVRIGTSSMTFAFEVWGEAFAGHPRRRAAAGRFVTVHLTGEHAGDVPARSSPWPAEWVAALRPGGPAVG